MLSSGRKGTWWLRSKTDPRWDCSGRCWVGGLVMPAEAEEAVEKLKKKYGTQPEDLEGGYMKD